MMRIETEFKLLENLTIGIPVKNGEKTIELLIQDLFIKYKNNLKILVSDNNSYDNTQSILRKIDRKYENVHVFYQKKDIGAEENFKFLVKRAETKYFMWIGADDQLNGDLVYAIKKMDSRSNISALSFKTSFSSKNIAKIYDRCNGPLNSRFKCLRLFKLLMNPGANSRFYSIYVRERLLDSLNVYVRNLLGADVLFSVVFCSKNIWDYSDEIQLKRGFGISSKPIDLRERYGYKGISRYLFFPKYLLKILVHTKPCFLILVFPLMIYWVRLLLSPIKHKIFS